MHILIVDDSKITRQVVKNALLQTQYARASFSEAEDGKMGLASVERLKPDLILSDWNMPEMDGLTFLQEIRKLDPYLPFGMITAQSTKSLEENAMKSGAHFLLSKPFTPQVLEAVILSTCGPCH